MMNDVLSIKWHWSGWIYISIQPICMVCVARACNMWMVALRLVPSKCRIWYSCDGFLCRSDHLKKTWCHLEYVCPVSCSFLIVVKYKKKSTTTKMWTEYTTFGPCPSVSTPSSIVYSIFVLAGIYVLGSSAYTLPDWYVSEKEHPDRCAIFCLASQTRMVNSNIFNVQHCASVHASTLYNGNRKI